MLSERLSGFRIQQFSRQQVFFFLAMFLILWRIPYYGKVILDDPYITFEYAKNLVDFGQLTYNPGENVLATTTPVYTFIMAGFYALGFDLPTAATIFNLLLEIAQLYVLGLLIAELSPPPRDFGIWDCWNANSFKSFTQYFLSERNGDALICVVDFGCTSFHPQEKLCTGKHCRLSSHLD